MTQRQDDRFVTSPRLDVAASAGGGSLVDGEGLIGSYAFSRDWITRRGLSTEGLAVISVAGDSMVPTLHDGRIFAVQYSGGLFVKRVQHLPGDRTFLTSDNKQYEPILLADEESNFATRVVGRVVASMHEW